MRTITLILNSFFFFSTTLFCQQNEPMIDVHLHAYNLSQAQSDTAWYPPAFHRPASSEKLMQESFDMMNKYHIVKAIISGDLKMVQKWQANDSGRLLPGYETWEPFTPEHIARIKQKIKSGEVKVLAEIVTQYNGIGASDSALEPLYALAEENDIPVGIHMGPGPSGIAFSTNYRSRLSSPLLLEEALVRHPKLRIYVMHAGWPMLDDMVAMLYAYPNLYVDIAVIDWYIPKAEFYFYLKRLTDAGFSNRIMFGSDQMQWPESISTAIETIQSAGFLTKQQKRDIFYNNAVRFFKLDKQK
jgi:predicted TIM-barrel fold metal-dependent hydrolase